MRILTDIRESLLREAERLADIEKMITACGGQLPECTTDTEGETVGIDGCNGNQATESCVAKRFACTSLFLRECFDYVMEHPAIETLGYLTGADLGDVVVLDVLIKFDFDRRGAAYVSGDIVSTTAALIDLDDHGFRLQGTLHNHPWPGVAAATPSSVDLRHHGRLEHGGYGTVGIIMTPDGYVRFYTNEMPFTVTVLGKDIQQVADDTYRLLLDFNPDECANPRSVEDAEFEEVQDDDA